MERGKVDLSLVQDRGKRFALRAMLHMMESAPDLEAAFENEEYRDAALGLFGFTCCL